MKQRTKPHLKGEVEVPDGRAPRAGWTPIDNSITRTEDHWIEGNLQTLLSDPDSWWETIRGRWSKPVGNVGVRIRFVMTALPGDAFQLLEFLSALAPAFPEDQEWLFLHAEVMEGPEQGLYIAYDNRPPALVTQLHLTQGGSSKGNLNSFPEGPLHVNVLFHDPDIDLRAVIQEGTLGDTLARLSLELGRVHELSLARCSDGELSGISIGLERVRQEQGAEGG